MEATLCIVGCLTVSLVTTHEMAVVTTKNVFRHCKMVGKRVRGGPTSAENH